MGQFTEEIMPAARKQMEEIRGALARGYTYPENSHKVLDGDLIDAMALEIANWVDLKDLANADGGYKLCETM